MHRISCTATQPVDLLEVMQVPSFYCCHGAFTFFWHVLLPLSGPALAANSALAMVFSWNMLFLPLLALNDEILYTLPLGTMQFFGQYMANWARLMAFIVLAMLPAVIFYLLAERHIVSGLTGGALKG